MDFLNLIQALFQCDPGLEQDMVLEEDIVLEQDMELEDGYLESGEGTFLGKDPVLGWDIRLVVEDVQLAELMDCMTILLHCSQAGVVVEWCEELDLWKVVILMDQALLFRFRRRI